MRIRRQGEVPPDELAVVTERARAWLGGHRDRGFSMALGRGGDPADARVLLVTAHDARGLVGVLGFVPWGWGDVSLDVMRRRPDAPHGVTELMVAELMAAAPRLGIRRVSLNFCMFRSVFEGAARVGGGTVTASTPACSARFDRFWQLERLYRSNLKYDPEWLPRFLCYDDAVALPHVAVAAGAAEGFLPWPALGRRDEHAGLDAGHLGRSASWRRTRRPPGRRPGACPTRCGGGSRSSSTCAPPARTPGRHRTARR